LKKKCGFGFAEPAQGKQGTSYKV